MQKVYACNEIKQIAIFDKLIKVANVEKRTLFDSFRFIRFCRECSK